jgi:RNA polymerase sigma factor for flagellar operon FliA
VTPPELFESELPMVRDVISFISRRRHFSREEAEDFSSFVFLKLMDNDYAIFQKYEGRASLRTYLTVVIERLSIDYRIFQWGKWRPSARAVELGPEAVELDSLLFRDGYSPHEAVQLLRSRGKTSLTEDALLGIASQLPSRPRRSRASARIPANLASVTNGADRGIREKERARELESVRRALDRAYETLSDEDQVVARLRFLLGWPPQRIAKGLGIEVKELYRRIEQLKKKLRRILEKEGIRGSVDFNE